MINLLKMEGVLGFWGFGVLVVIIRMLTDQTNISYSQVVINQLR